MYKEKRKNPPIDIFVDGEKICHVTEFASLMEAEEGFKSIYPHTKKMEVVARFTEKEKV